MHVCVPCVCLVPKEPEEDAKSPEIGGPENYEPPCGFWELNPRFSERAASAEPSLQPKHFLVLPL